LLRCEEPQFFLCRQDALEGRLNARAWDAAAFHCAKHRFRRLRDGLERMGGGQHVTSGLHGADGGFTRLA